MNKETEELTEDEVDRMLTDAAAADADPVDDEPIDPVDESTQEDDEPVDQADESDEQIDNSQLQGLLDTARQYGISTEGITSEAELTNRVFSQMRLMQDQMRYQQPLPPEPEPEPQDEWTESAHFQKQYGGAVWQDKHTQALVSGVVTQDPSTGIYKPTQGYETVGAQLAQEMNAATQHASGVWKDLTQSNPYEKIYSALREPIERMVQARIEAAVEARMRTIENQQQVSSFERDHGDWFYSTDPTTGARIVSDDGRRFAQQVEELRQNGVNDPATRISLAHKLTGLGLNGQKAAADKGSQEPNEKTTASAGAGAVNQGTQRKSFLENAIKKAGHKASSRGRVLEDGPQVSSAEDIDGMFEAELRARSAKK